MGLERSRSDKMIAGVCGGIARQFGWSATTVRVIYVLASPGILVYLVLWLVVPLEGSTPRS